MDPITMGILVGIAKNELIDRPKEMAEVKRRAITARFAPLRGESAPSFSDIKTADPFQSGLDFGLAGLAMKQQQDTANFNKMFAQSMQQPSGNMQNESIPSLPQDSVNRRANIQNAALPNLSRRQPSNRMDRAYANSLVSDFYPGMENI